MIKHTGDPPFLQRQAGHADPRLTLLIYTDVVDTDFKPTAEILERLCRYSAEGEGSASAVTRPCCSLR